MHGPIPVVKNVFLPEDFDGTLPIELEDAMPLFSFLAPVSVLSYKFYFDRHIIRGGILDLFSYEWVELGYVYLNRVK